MEELSRQTTFVAVVVAETQRSYWSRNNPFGEDLIPMTTTNYRVELELKGSLPAVVQADEFGARQDGSFPCSNWAWRIQNDPLPEVGHRYVLFLVENLGSGRYRVGFGSIGHLEIVDGTVYSLKDLNREAEFSINMKPESLDRFVARFE